jgi:hypothetical protein
MMAKADDIKAEILALKKRGVIKAEDVYYWAENNPNSAIYRSLEWDDAKAGVLYRIHQIRNLMTLYVIDKSGEPELVSLSLDRATPGGGYRVLTDVKAVPSLREILLEDVLAALGRLAHRYADFTELNDVWIAIAEAQATYGKKQAG